MNDIAAKPQAAYARLLDLLRRLDAAKICYRLRSSRDDAISVDVTVPGQRWEIEFVQYGDDVQVEIERFISQGEIGDASLLESLFDEFSD